MDISVVIIVKNGEKTIKNTLDSLKDFDDVVVYDNGSVDETIKICQNYSNVNLIQGDFIGFGPTKNKAVLYSKYNWIVILDSDEVLDSLLINSLKNSKLDKNVVYKLNFNAYYKQKQIRYCGWSNQKIIRVFNKTKTSFNDNILHENIMTQGLKISSLKGNVKHYSYLNISDFIQKTDKYSTLFAKQNRGLKKSSPLKAFLNAIYSFIKTYFFKRGFLDGYEGLLVAFSHMCTNFFKYIKLYEINKKDKNET